MTTYILSVESLFRVDAETEDEALRFLAENIGHEPYIPDEFDIIEVEQ